MLAAASSGAWGLGLGKLTVQSALGETLKAEIDITSISAEEAGTLKVRVAPPESYRATGVEYNAVLTGTQVQVVRRDGRNVLRVSSDRAVQEPFVDVILELTWASGRLVREYTLLFDPPANPKPSSAAPAVAAAPVISSPASEATPLPAAASRPRPPVPAPAVAEATRPRAEAPAPRPAPAPVPAPAPRAAAAPAASEYVVKPGDSLSRIAGKTQPAGISLDQMLVGLYRNNEDAFINGNMNRLKAGSVLQVPSAESLGSVSTAEARQVIRAQSADFNAYSQRLSGAAPTIKQDESDRQAKGRVQAAVDDRKQAAAPTPDKLTLSKAADGKTAAVSKDTEKKDSAARVAELTRNVEELKKLSSAAKPAAAPAPAPVAAPAPAPSPAPVVAAPVPAPVVTPPAPAPAPTPVASAPAPVASKPLPSTAAPAASKPASAALPPAPAAEVAEPSLLDHLLDNPLLPLSALLVAAAGGFGFYRFRNRKAQAKSDTGFQESRLQPDSFFGATGGQRVDTRDAANGASSMNYSLSQLDAIGDVDPVAEADVYLAYGRDLQAEEILKEALRANPERMAIRLKLLEVYAKRRDIKGFEQLAIQLYAETQGRGDDWAKAQELGRQIDPENPLYQPGGAPSLPASGREVHPEPMDASTLPHTVTAGHLATEPLGRNAPDTGPTSVFDLDLDLDLDSPAPAPSPISMEATQALPTTVDQAPMAMDFDLSPPATPTQAGGADLEFDLDDLSDDRPATVAPDSGNGALDFDLSSIDLDLPATPAAPAAPIPAPESTSGADLAAEFDALMNQVPEPAAPPVVPDIADLGLDDGDPLLRQLELADEFRQIGDTEGAREVLTELISKTSGALRDKAQAMLNELR